MKKLHTISEKKQKLIDRKLNSEITVGETVYVKHKDFTNYPIASKAEELVRAKVIEVSPDYFLLSTDTGSLREYQKPVKKTCIAGRETMNVGANPFNPRPDHCRSVAFTLESILFGLNIFGETDALEEKYTIGDIKVQPFNWNPYVYDRDGKKVRYQRAFVWNTEDKQLLVESIYNGIDCGRILIRKRGWDELEALAKNGETELYWKDIVDGKQRLDAVRAFIAGEFADLHGNYYADLAETAQRKFTDHQLFSYAEMQDNTKDEDVIYQFLRVNFTGVQMSKEHLEYVKSINI